MMGRIDRRIDRHVLTGAAHILRRDDVGTRDMQVIASLHRHAAIGTADEAAVLRHRTIVRRILLVAVSIRNAAAG